MKNLKKLVVFGVFLAATHAHAFETDFAPVQNSGEIEGIELFNGKLIVKSTGNIGGVPTQYMFLSTNTSNFAQSGFATTNMNNLTSMVFDENHIYATRESDTNHVYRFTIDDTDKLNGIKSDIKVYNVKEASKVLCVQDGIIYVQNKEESNTFTINAEGETASPPPVVVPDEIATNYVHSISKEGYVYFWDRTEFKKYIPETNTISSLGSYSAFESGEKTPISMVSLKNYAFVLDDTGDVFRINCKNQPLTGLRIAGKISGISYGSDGESIILTMTNKCVVYNTLNGGSKYIYIPPSIETNKFSQKEISSNGLKYSAKNKKIGYSIAD